MQQSQLVLPRHVRCFLLSGDTSPELGSLAGKAWAHAGTWYPDYRARRLYGVATWLIGERPGPSGGKSEFRGAEKWSLSRLQ